MKEDVIVEALFQDGTRKSMTLTEAAKLDDPEGVVWIKHSATWMKEIVERVETLEESNKNRQWLINNLRVDTFGIYDE